MEQDKEFVEYIIKQIVNNPSAVQISRRTDEMGVLLEVKVDPSDMGLLIGRQGATAKAIRILARIIGMRNNARVNLRIIEPEGSPKFSQPSAHDAGEAGTSHSMNTAPNTPATEYVRPATHTIHEKTKSVDDVIDDIGL
jgi:hypothetical protein